MSTGAVYRRAVSRELAIEQLIGITFTSANPESRSPKRDVKSLLIAGPETSEKLVEGRDSGQDSRLTSCGR